jgi:hypothetical protein
MGRKSLERVSQREYARQLGISNEAVSRAVKEGRIAKGWDKAAGKIIVEHANAEWGAIHMKTDVAKIIRQEPGESEVPNYPPAKISEGTLSLNGNSSFAEAKRVREIIQAQIASIQLKTIKEELVKKDEVYKQLFAFGQEIRISLMAIPDRVIDNILATKNRAEAHQLLTGEVHAALEALTRVDFNFTARQ